jgi:hypothetical protein
MVPILTFASDSEEEKNSNSNPSLLRNLLPVEEQGEEFYIFGVGQGNSQLAVYEKSKFAVLYDCGSSSSFSHPKNIILKSLGFSKLFIRKAKDIEESKDNVFDFISDDINKIDNEDNNSESPPKKIRLTPSISNVSNQSAEKENITKGIKEILLEVSTKVPHLFIFLSHPDKDHICFIDQDMIPASFKVTAFLGGDWLKDVNNDREKVLRSLCHRENTWVELPYYWNYLVDNNTYHNFIMPNVYNAVSKQNWDTLKEVHWDNVPENFHGTLKSLLDSEKMKFLASTDSSLKDSWNNHLRPLSLTSNTEDRNNDSNLNQVHIVSMNEAFNDVNDQSTILLCSMPDMKMNFICTGDASNASFQRIGRTGMDSIPPIINFEEYCNVLILPHHGSEENLSKLMFTQFNPHLVAISAGNGRQFGHPRQNTIEFYNNILTLRKSKGTLDFFDKFQVEGPNPNRFLAYKDSPSSTTGLLYEDPKLPFISTNLSGNFLFNRSGCFTNFSTVFEVEIEGQNQTVEIDFKNRVIIPPENIKQLEILSFIAEHKNIKLVKYNNSLHFSLKDNYLYPANIINPETK